MKFDYTAEWGARRALVLLPGTALWDSIGLWTMRSDLISAKRLICLRLKTRKHSLPFRKESKMRRPDESFPSKKSGGI